jgi:hypothetical protein
LENRQLGGISLNVREERANCNMSSKYAGPPSPSILEKKKTHSKSVILV